MGLFNRKKKNTEPPKPTPHTTIVIPDQITDTRRPCWARCRKALFHRWVASARPVLPRGEEPGENARYYQFRNVTALVEFEDGTVARFFPDDIQFVDDGGGFDRFTWPGENAEAQYGTE